MPQNTHTHTHTHTRQRKTQINMLTVFDAKNIEFYNLYICIDYIRYRSKKFKRVLNAQLRRCTFIELYQMKKVTKFL